MPCSEPYKAMGEKLGRVRRRRGGSVGQTHRQANRLTESECVWKERGKHMFRQAHR